jgi:tRNA wybutosine-synthesizing protein 4
MQVVIHQASTNHMDFISKNFLTAINAGEKLYLRSLSAEKPSELPANISRDFPGISEDFDLPPELTMVIENAHSSPLRISGPVDMWLHYE